MSDLRLAVRDLFVTPVVSLTAILSLALGIGANSALFSLLNSLVLRPLPVTEPQRLAIVSGGIPTFPLVPRLPGYTYRIWTAVAERAPFDGVCAWAPARFDLAEHGESQPADGLYVSAGYFKTLGVREVLGRTFTREEDGPGTPRTGHVAVISYGLWQHRFGGAADVIGKRLLIERVPFTVVGVTARDFSGTEVGRGFDVAVPIGSAAAMGRAYVLPAWIFRILVRLRPGQSIEQATVALRALQPGIRETAAPDAPPNLDVLRSPLTLLPASSGTSALRQRYEQPLLVLFGVVALVLLVACANIANVLHARTTARRHEFSVRAALGASRWRLARRLLVESLLLSTIGAGLGLVLAAWGGRALVAQLSTPVNRVILDVSVDWRVAGFTAAVALLTAVLFGILPGLASARVSPVEAMKEHARAGVVRGWRRGVAGRLVVVQVTLSLVLLTATGTFLQSFVRLATVPRGLDAGRVLLVNVSTAHTLIAPSDRLRLFERLIHDISMIPGVSAVGGSTLTPASGIAVTNFVNVAGAPVMHDSKYAAATNVITPGWLAATGLCLRGGRDFDAHDTDDRPPVAIVNEAFARKFFGDHPAVGNAFVDGQGVRTSVVGVVSDAVYNSVREPAPAEMFLPLAQNPAGLDTLAISVRAATGPPARLARPIARTISADDRDLAFTFRELGEQIDASISQDRLLATLSAFFGALALVLAGLGVYGVTAHAAAHRRKEMAIRLAVGATPSRVMGLMVRSLAAAMGIGLAAGTAVCLWTARFVQSLIYGVNARDPLMLLSAAIVLTGVAALAACVPTWRASRLDPADVLRET